MVLPYITTIFAIPNQHYNTKIMENDAITNSLSREGRKITLRGYYKNLPEPTFPKRDFIQEVATKCNVTLTTANNWVKYGIKPNNPEHVRILSEITGIEPENLWID